METNKTIGFEKFERAEEVCEFIGKFKNQIKIISITHKEGYFYNGEYTIFFKKIAEKTGGEND